MKKNVGEINDALSDEEVELINPCKKFIFAPVPNWLMRREGVSAGAKLLYGRLCQYAGNNGECYPSIKTLAKELAKLPEVKAPEEE